MLNLLIKDFKLMFDKERNSITKIITSIISAIFVIIFVVLEGFLYYAVFDKIKIYKNAPQAVMTIFLLVISLLMIISGVLKAQKLFFNEKDLKQLTNYPVSNSQIILSKLIFLFFSHYVTAFLFVYPLFFAYGQVFSKTAIYYYLALFYPVFSFFFEMGVALLLVYPVWMFSQYLKKHVAFQFVLAMILLFAGTFAYSKILMVFIDLVAKNQISTLFSTSSLEKFVTFEKYAFPANLLCDIFIRKSVRSFFPYACIALGIFALGLAVTVFTFHYVRNISVSSKPSKKKYKFKKLTPTQALIKKEVILLTKNANYIFSFSGLLIVQPFLLYLIITAMNTIFSAGLFRYYLTLIPEFITLLDMFLIVMFTLIINQGANNYISMEERTIKNMKTIPVSYKTQLLIKTAIPFSLSFISMFISLIVLTAFGVITVGSALIALLLTTVCLFVFDAISLKEELSIRHGKGRKTYLSSLYAYLLPFSFIVVGIVLSFLGTSMFLIYSVGILVLALFGVPPVISLYKNMGSLFMDLEAIN